MISDQGREFVNHVKENLFALTGKFLADAVFIAQLHASDQQQYNRLSFPSSLAGTSHRVASAYHPQSNGLTERFNQTLQSALLKVVNETQTEWDEHLPAILFAYRTSKQKATKLTPFEIMYCR